MVSESLFSRGNNNYQTPKELYDLLDKVFKFELDPCASETIEGQARINTQFKYTLEQDGLKQDWQNLSTYINPPYSKIKQWVRKAIDEYDKRLEVPKEKPKPIVLLIPARTDTMAFHEIVTHPYARIIFIKGRLRFHNTKTNAPFPSCLVILSPSSYMDKLWDYLLDSQPEKNIRVIASWTWPI